MRSLRFLVGATVLTLFASANVKAADTYKVDGVHSSVIFRCKHLNVGHVYGRFNKFSGTFQFGDKNVAECALQMEVKADSVDSGNGDRDRHLKGADFFSVKEFPTISFKSTAFKQIDDNNYEVTGDMTLHGETKPITVKLERLGTGKDPRGGARSGWESTFTIKRSDFGMKFMLQGISDEIKIIVAVEGTK